ncbi:MAG: hypothetical protein QXJ28_02025 [Candidatus Pacearchaeota archaeon]
MRFNFKKVASVLACTAMLGSTLGFAAAASYPEPFVKAGSADVAIVFGANAAPSDNTAALDIGASLSSYLTKTRATSGLTPSEESVAISRASSRLILGSTISNVWGLSAVTRSDLPNLLADGVFLNRQNNENRYEQEIKIGDLQYKHFSDADYNNRVPDLGFHITPNTVILNYTLRFRGVGAESTQGTDLVDFENRVIKILGKEYYILDFKNSTPRITLLDSATTVALDEKDSRTVNVGGKEYTISVFFISTDEVILTVNGENTEKLSATGTSYGSTFKLKDGTYIGIRSINVQNYAGGAKNVEFSIGRGKLELIDGGNVKINDKTISDLTSYITLGDSGSKRTWQGLTIEWKSGDEAFLTPSKELVMPGFEAIKLTMADATIPAKEITRVEPSGSEAIELRTTIKDGEVTLPLVYISTTSGNITGIGKSATQKLATSNNSYLIYNATSSSVSQYEGFIASWAGSKEAESYYLRATVRRDTDAGKNYTSIINKISGQTICEDLDDVTRRTCTIGNVILTVNSVQHTPGGDSIVNLSIGSGGSFNKLYTAEGLMMYLPYEASVTSTANKGSLNVTGTTDRWMLWLAEESKEGTLESRYFHLNISSSGSTSRKATVSQVGEVNTSLETAQSSKIYESYIYSDLATKILHDQTNSDQYSAEVEYHGGQVYANLFLAAPTAEFGGEVSTTIVPVTDSEVSSVSSKNLIVVGGSCINSVAANLINAPACGVEWTARTGVGAGEFLIQTFESPYTPGKVATLVAGYEASDTKNAANALVSKKPEIAVGKKYKGNTAEVINVVA